MDKATVCEKTITYGQQHYRSNGNGKWQVLMYGSHGPNDPPVGLSWKWGYISEDKIPKEVKKLGLI